MSSVKHVRWPASDVGATNHASLFATWLAAAHLVGAVACGPASTVPGEKSPMAQTTRPSSSASAPPRAAGDTATRSQYACDFGDARSCIALGVMYQNGSDGLQASSERAADLYQRACDLGDVRGCNNLAVMFEKGDGRPQDVRRALEMYERSCNLNHALACRNVGRAYRDGLGADRDPARSAAAYSKAFELSTKMCAGNVAEGCSNLGFMYRSGNEGVTADDAKAREFLKRACDLGYRAICSRIDPDAASPR
jgi:TPR repeat protein